MTRRTNSAGFTLIEVLVALLITATAIVTLLSVREQAIQQTAETRDARVSWELAVWAMGDVLAVEAPEWKDSAPPTTPWEIPTHLVVPHAEGFRVEYSAEIEEKMISDEPDAEPEMIFKVTVEVFPPSGTEARPGGERGAKTIKLVSYYPYGGS